MSFHERTGHRDLAMSRWQRPQNIRRHLPDWRWASLLPQIDIDSLQVCPFCAARLAMIEYQESARAPKAAQWTQGLAEDAGVPAFSLSYMTDGDGDVTHFRLRQLSPTRTATANMTPRRYARWLCDLRRDHFPWCPAPAAAQLDWIWAELQAA
jgi:hypothetical protein